MKSHLTLFLLAFSFEIFTHTVHFTSAEHESKQEYFLGTQFSSCSRLLPQVVSVLFAQRCVHLIDDCSQLRKIVPLHLKLVVCSGLHPH